MPLQKEMPETRLNVYRLRAHDTFSRICCCCAAYHTAVQVGTREYSFAQGVGVVSAERDPAYAAGGAAAASAAGAPATESSSSSSLLVRPGRVGVGSSRGRSSGEIPVSAARDAAGAAAEDPSDAEYAYSIDMGTCLLSGAEIEEVLQQLEQQFTRDSYHLVERNCNHFSDALCRRLVGRGVPSYITRAAWCARWFTCFFPRSAALPARSSISRGGLGSSASTSASSCGAGRQQQRSSSRRVPSQPLRLFGGTGQRLGSSSEGTAATTVEDASSDAESHAAAAAGAAVPPCRETPAAASSAVEKLGDALRALTDRWRGTNKSKELVLQQHATLLSPGERADAAAAGSSWAGLEFSRALLADAAKARLERQKARLQQQREEGQQQQQGGGQRPQQEEGQQQQQERDRPQQQGDREQQRMRQQDEEQKDTRQQREEQQAQEHAQDRRPQQRGPGESPQEGEEEEEEEEGHLQQGQRQRLERE